MCVAEAPTAAEGVAGETAACAPNVPKAAPATTVAETTAVRAAAFVILILIIRSFTRSAPGRAGRAGEPCPATKVIVI
jgi:hypothetical protein